MSYLLDTHAFLWLIANDPRLSARAGQVIASATSGLYLSIATPWEIAIKVGIGKLVLNRPFPTYLPREIARNDLQVLPIHLDHLAIVATLPRHHGDPFDRLLAAQASVEGLTIVSVDPIFDNYGVPRVW